MVLGLLLLVVVLPAEAAAASTRDISVRWHGQFFPDVEFQYGGAGAGWYDTEAIPTRPFVTARGDLTVESTSPLLTAREMVFSAQPCKMKSATYCVRTGDTVQVTGQLPLTLHVRLTNPDSSVDAVLLTVMPARVAGTQLTTVEDFEVHGTLTLVSR